jgi:acetyltransferase-like isoleucine patch superfamily enzyme
MNIYRKYLGFKRKFLPYLFSSKDFLKLLAFDRISVGVNTIFYDPISIIVDSTRPELIKIGSFCKITHGVTILTHDYSRSVLRIKYKAIIPEANMTLIGDNVFIGINSIILMGSRIGNNTIIGAGSVVSGYFPDDVVIAGNPAKVVMTIEAHYQKQFQRIKRNASIFLNAFIEKYKRNPRIHEMGHFPFLFIDRNEETLKKYGLSLKLNGDDYDDIKLNFFSSKKMYNNYDDFINQSLNYKGDKSND